MRLAALLFCFSFAIEPFVLPTKVCATELNGEPELSVSLNTMQYFGHGAIPVDDIAIVTGTNNQLVKQVKSLLVPWPTATNRLTKQDLTQHIKQQLPSVDKQWRAGGLSQIFLKQCWQLSGADVERVAKLHIEKWLNGTDFRLKSISYHDDLDSLCVPSESNTIAVKDYQPTTLFSKQRLTFLIAGRHEFSAVMLLELEQLSPVLVADKSKDSQISRNDIDWQWLAVNHSKLLGNALKINGLIASRQLRAGTVINHSNTRVEPLVEAGEQLEFRMQDGALLITGKAKALGEGQLGDEINIMLESSSQAIRAKIIQEGVVVVAN